MSNIILVSTLSVVICGCRLLRPIYGKKSAKIQNFVVDVRRATF